METILTVFPTMPTLEFVLRIFAATVLGAVIGFERTKRSKEAGIRTHCIIACASALIMVVSQWGFQVVATGSAADITRGADPARVAAQVVSGISFLGAGVIFKNGNAVKGLTTAAGIWATAAVGLACGCGMYVLAAFVTVLIVAIQMLLHRFSIGYDAFSTTEIRLTIVDSPELRGELKKMQEELGIAVLSSRITVGDDGTLEMHLTVRQKTSMPFDQVVKFIENHPGVKSVSI